MSKLKQDTTFYLPHDGTDDATLVVRFTIPAGTDRRGVRKIIRKICEEMGYTNHREIIKKMGWSKYA